MFHTSSCGLGITTRKLLRVGGGAGDGCLVGGGAGPTLLWGGPPGDGDPPRGELECG